MIIKNNDDLRGARNLEKFTEGKCVLYFSTPGVESGNRVLEIIADAADTIDRERNVEYLFHEPDFERLFLGMYAWFDGEILHTCFSQDVLRKKLSGTPLTILTEFDFTTRSFEAI
jgi:hypothetical protein